MDLQFLMVSFLLPLTAGTVAQWGASIQVGDEQVYTIDFQVWRQSETGNDLYSIAGRICSMSSSHQEGTLPGCITVPSEERPIRVQPGDLVGFQFLYNEDTAGDGGDEGVPGSGGDRRRRSDNHYDYEGSAGSGSNINIEVGFSETTAAPVVTASMVPIATVQPPMMSVTPEETTFATESVVTPTETLALLATASVSTTLLLSVPDATSSNIAPSNSQPMDDVTGSSALNIAPSNSRTAATGIIRTTTQLPSPSTVRPSPTDGEELNPETSSDTTANSSTSKEAIIGIVIGVLIFIIAVLVVLVMVFALRLRSISQRQYTSGSGARSRKFKLNARRWEASEEDTRAIIESHDSYSLLGEVAPTSITSGYSIIRMTSNPSRTLASVEGEYAYNRHTYETIEPQPPPTATSNHTTQSTYRQSASYAEISTLPRQNTGVSEPTRIFVPTEEERTAVGSHYEMAEMHQYSTLKFFIEDQTYWAPASSTSDLYAQLAAKKYREIPRQQIMQREELGCGQFGQVHKGLWQPQDSRGATLEIAVKTLKCDAPESDKVKFLQEAAIMGQFSHPNVIHLYGLVTVDTPVMIVLELMSNGDLRSYIRGLDMDQYHDSARLEQQFLRFMQETAAGMAYLSGKSFVHRDLAARNILLDQNFTCKIGDFGLARDLMNETYYISNGGQIPVKWTAPEALFYKKYSQASDVWSYGMVLFEIWSLGRKPFQNLSNAETVNLVKTGYCQPPPPACPRAVYKLMVDCWNPTHHERPTFVSIGGYLKGPDRNLLAWAEENGAISKTARGLGGPISESRNLFLDLQNQYKEPEQT